MGSLAHSPASIYDQSFSNPNGTAIFEQFVAPLTLAQLVHHIVDLEKNPHAYLYCNDQQNKTACVERNNNLIDVLGILEEEFADIVGENGKIEL